MTLEMNRPVMYKIHLTNNKIRWIIIYLSCNHKNVWLWYTVQFYSQWSICIRETGGFSSFILHILACMHFIRGQILLEVVRFNVDCITVYMFVFVSTIYNTYTNYFYEYTLRNELMLYSIWIILFKLRMIFHWI